VEHTRKGKNRLISEGKGKKEHLSGETEVCVCQKKKGFDDLKKGGLVISPGKGLEGFFQQEKISLFVQKSLVQEGKTEPHRGFFCRRPNPRSESRQKGGGGKIPTGGRRFGSPLEKGFASTD